VSVTSRRAARRELEAAKVLGTERVRWRPRYVSAPDVLPVRLPSGDVLQAEVKTTRCAPKRILAALAQARKYAPSAVPVAVFSQTGGEAIACVPLADFARLLGLQVPKAGQQLALLGTKAR
jgi:hypothetical protein